MNPGDPSDAQCLPKLAPEDAWLAHVSAQQHTCQHGPGSYSAVSCCAELSVPRSQGQAGKVQAAPGEGSAGDISVVAAPWHCQVVTAYGELAGVCDHICKALFLWAELIMEALK